MLGAFPLCPGLISDAAAPCGPGNEVVLWRDKDGRPPGTGSRKPSPTATSSSHSPPRTLYECAAEEILGRAVQDFVIIISSSDNKRHLLKNVWAKFLIIALMTTDRTPVTLFIFTALSVSLNGVCLRTKFGDINFFS